MELSTRRQFDQRTVLAAAAFYRGSVPTLLEDVAGRSEQNPDPVDVASMRKLVSAINGHVIIPKAAEYESARQVFNRAFDRRPAVIVRCAGSSDVAHALDFAQTKNLTLAVRGGGHSRVGYGMCDGA
jgi:hypothetical protein